MHVLYSPYFAMWYYAISNFLGLIWIQGSQTWRTTSLLMRLHCSPQNRKYKKNAYSLLTASSWRTTHFHPTQMLLLRSNSHQPSHHQQHPGSFTTSLTALLINSTCIMTLWEIRVMKSDGGVHADPLHLVYFSRRSVARLRSEKASHILIMVRGNLLAPSGDSLMNRKTAYSFLQAEVQNRLIPTFRGGGLPIRVKG